MINHAFVPSTSDPNRCSVECRLTREEHPELIATIVYNHDTEKIEYRRVDRDLPTSPDPTQALRERLLEDAAMFLVRTRSYREARAYLEGFTERWEALASPALGETAGKEED